MHAIVDSRRDELAALCRRFGVQRLEVFGSAARDDFDEEHSDVDLLVDFERPIGLFEFLRLRRTLSSLIGRPVDLVTRAALKPQLRDRILAEAIRAT